MAKKVHPFNYFVSHRDKKRPLKIQQRRDLAAAQELLPILYELGYKYGEPILNFPPHPLPEKPLEEPFYAIELSFVRPGDVLLQTTRPPLHDWEHGDMKKVSPGFTDVEEKLFALWRRHLEVCARSHMKLTQTLRSQLKEGFESRREMAFRQRVAAPYLDLNALDGRGWRRQPPSFRRTAAFLLRVDEAWKGGPGLIGAFGMDGTATQIWAYRLARDFPQLLQKPGFTMAEITIGEIPKRPTDLRWSRDWDVEIILEFRQ